MNEEAYNRLSAAIRKFEDELGNDTQLYEIEDFLWALRYLLDDIRAGR